MQAQSEAKADWVGKQGPEQREGLLQSLPNHLSVHIMADTQHYSPFKESQSHFHLGCLG